MKVRPTGETRLDCVIVTDRRARILVGKGKSLSVMYNGQISPDHHFADLATADNEGRVNARPEVGGEILALGGWDDGHVCGIALAGIEHGAFPFTGCLY